MAATVTGILLYGAHAGRPGSGVPTGTLYACSDHALIYQTTDTGATWVTWATLGGTVPSFAAPTIALSTAAAAGAAGTIIRSDATIAAFDATVPVTQNYSDAAATGSAAYAARRDHVHGMPASGAVSFANTITLGGTAANGAASTALRSDATIDAFDATDPAATSFGNAAVVGTADFAARRDHVHPRIGDTFTVNFIIDGGGSAITTGIKGDIFFDYACTINQVTVLADQSGSIVVDIWEDTYANYPPVDADSITASAPPTLSSASKSQDSTLTGWSTTAIVNGSVLRFNVDSITTCTRVLIALKVTRTS
jgi:hypothetical protein